MPIAQLIDLDTSPVAIYRAKNIPEGAHVPEGHCSIPPLFLMAAKNRKTCAADRAHIFCHGAVSGLGFGPIQSRQRSAWSMSVVPEEVRADMRHAGSGGQREYADCGAALAQMSEIKDYPGEDDAIVFEPLDVAEAKGAPIEVVALLADPTRLSALIILAGYDKRTPGSAVKILIALARLPGNLHHTEGRRGLRRSPRHTRHDRPVRQEIHRSGQILVRRAVFPVEENGVERGLLIPYHGQMGKSAGKGRNRAT